MRHRPRRRPRDKYRKYRVRRVGKTMSLCNKQPLSNIWGSIYQKGKQY